ncbi:MAG: TetR/AcrR family transcriptional regulator [Coprococcus sp.]|nr:TetR/AcrR family transcriptional regulator [Coprococcus sp.]
MIKKKEIQRHRMVRYFVEAACSIADSQGTDAVTARKVAELAGYNAATLYNYFDNLPHLLYFIHLRHLKDYAQALPHAIRDIDHPILLYMKICECFNEHGFQKPQQYYTIFFSEHSEKFNEHLRLYYDAFPEELPPEGLYFYPAFKQNDVHQKDYNALMAAARKGFLKEEDVVDIVRINFLIFGGMLRHFLSFPSEIGSADKAACIATRYQAHTLAGYGVSPELLTDYY